MRVLISLFLVGYLSVNANGQLVQDTFDVKLFNEDKSFSFSEIQDVDIDSRGYIWLSMTNHGLMRINQDEGKRYDYRQTGRTRNDVYCFYEDGHNRIFLGVGGGIDQYDFEKDEFRRVAENSFSKGPTYSLSIEDIIQIPNGKYLVAAKSGVHLLDHERDTIEQFNITGVYKVDPESSDKHTYSLVLDKKRNVVWCGTRSGLLKIDLDDFKSELIACPFHEDGTWPLNLMTDLYLFQDEVFVKFKNTKILSYNVISNQWNEAFSKRFKEYLPSYTRDSFDLYLMPTTCFEDRYLVIPSTRMGLHIYDMKTKKDLKPYLKHDILKGISKFESSDHLAHRYASETYFGVIDKHGFLWTSEIREIILKTEVPIFETDVYADPHDLQVSQVLVNNQPVKLKYYKDQNLQYDFRKYERDITLDFDLVNPSIDEYELQYSVNDSEFKPCFNKSLATLSQLKGGDNEIVLRAISGDSPVRIKKLDLNIGKYWHEQWSSRFIILALLLALLSIMYYVKMKRVEEKAQLENDFNKKIAEVKMAAFRSQMNPHFMFNSLNSINQFIVRMEPKKASEYLSKFSNLMRQILANSTSQLVSLESDIQALKLYLEMEGLRFGDSFEHNIKIDENINAKDCMVPPLLIQPYVENAIWHALMPKKEKGLLQVAVKKEDGQIKISIDDNGIGRIESLKINQSKIVKTKSMGMEITKNRLALVEKVYDVQTELKIIDKYDEEKPLGTLVELIMPYLSKQKYKGNEGDNN